MEQIGDLTPSITQSSGGLNIFSLVLLLSIFNNFNNNSCNNGCGNRFCNSNRFF